MSSRIRRATHCHSGLKAELIQWDGLSETLTAILTFIGRDRASSCHIEGEKTLALDHKSSPRLLVKFSDWVVIRSDGFYGAVCNDDINDYYEFESTTSTPMKYRRVTDDAICIALQWTDFQSLTTIIKAVHRRWPNAVVEERAESAIRIVLDYPQVHLSVLMAPRDFLVVWQSTNDVGAVSETIFKADFVPVSPEAKAAVGEVTQTSGVRSQLYTMFPGSKFAPRFDLLPLEGLRRWAEAFGEGTVKYGDDNFRKGFTDKVLIQHALAHIYGYLDGDESEDNLGHALWNLGLLCQIERDRPDLMTLRSERNKAKAERNALPLPKQVN